ncbi:hypothetical protein [Rhodopirellula bahusiensis]|uniref:hypothetical protein n=1 Tax=Rhodopirellula bahusiensis TaxID=2014065 RepID=UPI0018ED5043|nr:hypothetical protein [Rhodopirellula bahusiensis]
MSRLRKELAWAFVVVCFGLIGCGGAETPPPLGEELQQQIEQEDKLVADQESAM